MSLPDIEIILDLPTLTPEIAQKITDLANDDPEITDKNVIRINETLIKVIQSTRLQIEE